MGIGLVCVGQSVGVNVMVGHCVSVGVCGTLVAVNGSMVVVGGKSVADEVVKISELVSVAVSIFVEEHPEIMLTINKKIQKSACFIEHT